MWYSFRKKGVIFVLDIHFQELHTPRLLLRRLTPEDLPLYYSRLAGSETVTRYMLWKPHTRIEESQASIQKALKRYETGESCRWVIAEKGTGNLMGIIDLMPQDPHTGTCTFAYMLGAEFWGQGYGTEAVKAVIGYAFSHCGALVVQADHFADNPASGKVMEKAGMIRIGTIPEKYEKNNRLHDAQVYRLTKAQWLKQQSR